MIEFSSGYFIDENGAVISMKSKTPRVLAVNKNNKGYATIRICQNGKRQTKSVHRIYAEAYIPNPENKPFINHIDGNRMNYSIDNLEWCTQSENILHSFTLGRENPKVNSDVIVKIKELMDIGYGCRKIAKELNISKSTANIYMRRIKEGNCDSIHDLSFGRSSLGFNLQVIR